MVTLSEIRNPHFQQLENAIIRTQNEAHGKHRKMQSEGNQECNCLCGKSKFCVESQCFLEYGHMEK